MTNLIQWAIRHNIPHDALVELRQMMGVDKDTDVTGGTVTGSESKVQELRRLKATRNGGRLWRNQKGVLKNDVGVPVRFGLCNDNPKVGKRIRSSDLVGINPVLITQEMVGHIIGQFDAEEVKRPGWKYTGTEHEVAQLAFGELVMSLGGRFRFVSSEDD